MIELEKLNEKKFLSYCGRYMVSTRLILKKELDTDNVLKSIWQITRDWVLFAAKHKTLKIDTHLFADNDIDLSINVAYSVARPKKEIIKELSVAMSIDND
jgi:hypothetical protein